MHAESSAVDSTRGRLARGRAIVVLTISVLAACSSDAELSVAVQPLPALLSTAAVRFRIDAGVRAWTVTLPASAEGRGRRSSDAFDTPTTGTARVAFVLVLPDGREAASGDVSIPLRRDWRWGVELVAATEDPRDQCFGCFGSKAFPLPAEFRTAGRDSVWLVWGGNSIRDPVVY